MPIPYVKQIWINDDIVNSPISAERLNYMEAGIADATNVGSAAVPISKRGQSALETQRSSAMLPWFAALANRDNAPAKVYFIGDSITEGEGATSESKRWVERLRDALRRRFPTDVIGSGGGQGFISAYHETTTIGQPFALAGSPGKDSSFGLARKSLILNASGKKMTRTVVGTSIDVHTVIGSAGTLSVTVDGGAAITVTSVSGTIGGETRSRVSLGAAGSHVVEMAWASGSVYVTGITVYNGDENSGIQVAEAGWYGQNTNFWTGGYQFQGPTKMYAPQLVVIAISINDYSANKTIAEIKPKLLSVIEMARADISRAGVPAPTIVLVPWYLRSGTFTGDPWTAYVSMMHDIAAADPLVAVFDEFARMPSADTDTLGLYLGDKVHPSNKGHALIADSFAGFLSPR